MCNNLLVMAHSPGPYVRNSVDGKCSSLKVPTSNSKASPFYNLSKEVGPRNIVKHTTWLEQEVLLEYYQQWQCWFLSGISQECSLLKLYLKLCYKATVYYHYKCVLELLTYHGEFYTVFPQASSGCVEHGPNGYWWPFHKKILEFLEKKRKWVHFIWVYYG